MGDVIPFRKRRWTRPEDYGHRPSGNGRGQGGGGKPPGRPPRGPRPLAILALWVLAIGLAALWVLSDPMLYAPPGFLSARPEQVTGPFTRCSADGGPRCVLDGDRFRIGSRTVRIVGIDAPEIAGARCTAEAAAGDAAAAELQRLLNQAPFTLTARFDRPVDEAGQELRAITRLRPDRSVQSIATDLQAAGKVHRYLGGMRGSWCPRART